MKKPSKDLIIITIILVLSIVLIALLIYQNITPPGSGNPAPTPTPTLDAYTKEWFP